MEMILKLVVAAVLIAIGLFFVGWASILVLVLALGAAVTQLCGMKIIVTKNGEKIGYIKRFKFHQSND